MYLSILFGLLPHGSKGWAWMESIQKERTLVTNMLSACHFFLSYFAQLSGLSFEKYWEQDLREITVTVKFQTDPHPIPFTEGCASENKCR